MFVPALVIAALALLNAARLVWARQATLAPVSRPFVLRKAKPVTKILVFV